MPGLDRTGPESNGPRTGRGLGKCNPDSQSKGPIDAPEDLPEERGFGIGFGRGRGQGRFRFRGGGRGLGRNRL